MSSGNLTGVNLQSIARLHRNHVTTMDEPLNPPVVPDVRHKDHDVHIDGLTGSLAHHLS